MIEAAGGPAGRTWDLGVLGSWGLEMNVGEGLDPSHDDRNERTRLRVSNVEEGLDPSHDGRNEHRERRDSNVGEGLDPSRGA
jgi:hypothetical protein